MAFELIFQVLNMDSIFWNLQKYSKEKLIIDIKQYEGCSFLLYIS